MAMPSKNYAAVLHSVEDVRVEERPVPVPGPREVLVEVRSVGVCGSDVHYFEHGRIGDFVVRDPLILGHEAAGIVIASGRDAHRHALGERVALEPGIPCMHCEICRSGSYNLCRDVRFFATPPIDGAFAHYVSIDEDFAFSVPDTVSFDTAALLEPLSVGIWAARKAQVQPGTRVVITGSGPIGLCVLQAVSAFGASDITVTDINTARLETASRLGAETLNTASNTLEDSGIESDVVIDCSGNPGAIRDAIQTLRVNGRVVLVGMGSDDAPLPLSVIQRRELTVTGTFRYANTYPAAISMVQSGRADLDALVTGHFPLSGTADALREGSRNSTAIKTIVEPFG